MIIALRCFFSLVLLSMLAITGWAASRGSVLAIPREVFTHPWFLATLADAYWAFLTFFGWVAWKEQAWLARLLWLISILALGNLAMAAYALRELGSVKSDTSLAEVLTRRQDGRLVLPACLAGAGVAVYLLA